MTRETASNIICNVACIGLAAVGAYAMFSGVTGTLWAMAVLPVFVALMPEHREGWLPFLLRWRTKPAIGRPPSVRILR